MTHDAPVGWLALLAAVGPVAVAVGAWLLRRYIQELDAGIKTAHGSAREAMEEAEGAQALATTALQRVEIMQATGPFQPAAHCRLAHEQEATQRAHLSTTLGEIKALIQTQRQEDREDRARLWERVDNVSGRLQVVETLLQKGGAR